jgi:hypothetical protein
MNLLLIRKNEYGFAEKYTPAPWLAPHDAKVCTGLNHSVELNTPEIVQRYSTSLRTLIMWCMMRECGSRPTSTELVDATQAGLDASVATTFNSPSSSDDWPKRFAAIPLVPLKQPRPPRSWLVDTSRNYIQTSQQSGGSSAPQNTGRSSVLTRASTSLRRWVGFTPRTRIAKPQRSSEDTPSHAATSPVQTKANDDNPVAPKEGFRFQPYLPPVLNRGSQTRVFDTGMEFFLQDPQAWEL